MPDASFPKGARDIVKVEYIKEGPFKGEPTTFFCVVCKTTKTVGRGGLRGYGVRSVTRDGHTEYEDVCYDCSARATRRALRQMRNSEKVPA